MRVISDKEIDVTEEAQVAENAVLLFNPGEQPDIGKLMKAAYVHGYRQAMLDYDVLSREPTGNNG